MDKLIAILVATLMTAIGLSAWFFIIGFLFDSEMWMDAGVKVFIIGGVLGLFNSIRVLFND